MEPVKKSLISLHIAVILLGGTGLFSHIIPLSATDITLGRSLFACIALFCVVLLGKEGLALGRRRDYGIAIGLGVNGSALDHVFRFHAVCRRFRWHDCHVYLSGNNRIAGALF